MWEMILDTFIKMIVDGLEDFFNVMVYPNKKYLQLAIYICLGFLVFGLLGLVFEFYVIVTYPEAISALIMLLIIYVASIVTKSDINKVTTIIKDRTKAITVNTKSKKKGAKKRNGKKQ
jgi:undecaprenyl pyrophosphate phosphatase UppP